MKTAIIALALALIPLTAHAESGTRVPPVPHYDPSLRPLLILMQQKYPAPEGCKAVGIWEDGSQVAYCVDTDQWVARGPDDDDAWQRYDGPLMDIWVERAQG